MLHSFLQASTTAISCTVSNELASGCCFVFIAYSNMTEHELQHLNISTKVCKVSYMMLWLLFCAVLLLMHLVYYQVLDSMIKQKELPQATSYWYSPPLVQRVATRAAHTENKLLLATEVLMLGPARWHQYNTSTREYSNSSTGKSARL